MPAAVISIQSPWGRDGYDMPRHDARAATRWFVSHAYRDKAAMRALHEAVPRGVKLVPFPWEEPDAANPVSEGIVAKILACDGIIYLERGRSAASGWVRFERDYALRIGKPVFAFDPKTRDFLPDDGAPLDLRVQVFVSPKSQKRAQRLLQWMRHSRGFDIGKLAPVHHTDEVSELIKEMAAAQKLVVWLVDSGTENYQSYERDLEDEGLDREVPEGWWPPPRIFARIDPAWQPLSNPDSEVMDVANSKGLVLRDVLDLVEGTAKDGLNWNRVDDLIVRITLRLAEPPFARGD